MRRKRRTFPKYKPGWLTFHFGWLEKDSTSKDFVATGLRSDAHFLLHVLDSKRIRADINNPPFFWSESPSIIEELDARGYDTSTIKFSIEKKKTA